MVSIETNLRPHVNKSSRARWKLVAGDEPCRGYDPTRHCQNVHHISILNTCTSRKGSLTPLILVHLSDFMPFKIQTRTSEDVLRIVVQNQLRTNNMQPAKIPDIEFTYALHAVRCAHRALQRAGQIAISLPRSHATIEQGLYSVLRPSWLWWLWSTVFMHNFDLASQRQRGQAGFTPRRLKYCTAHAPWMRCMHGSRHAA
mmetsp:Transcript_30450/g.77018  ORF Transcript_30450/g.77018 Transcript_30450/m.77018 type:complete len:200 (+) Transcript_30450:234-833(+)